MRRVPVSLVLSIGLLAGACGSGGDKSAGRVAATTATTAAATTSSTVAPTTCPKVRPASEPAAPANLADLQMVRPTKGFAVGKGTILGTDDGRTWTSRFSGAAAFSSVDAIDATHAWAVGDRALYRTADGGKSWKGAGNPDDGTVLRQVHFVDEHFGWGVARNGKLYRSGDAGGTWGELSPPCGAEAVCFTAQDDGWVAAGNRVAHSTNGGDFWTPVLKEAMTGPSDITAPGGGSYPGPLSALGPDSAAFVLLTPPGEPPVSVAVAADNGGRIGPARPVPGLASPLAAAFLSADAGWILGTKSASPTADAILATADGGRTWQEQFARPAPAR